MKSSDACKLLQITKPTLYKYKNYGFIKANRLPNGYWDFDDDSIYSFFNKDVPRKIYAYARVSTNKQKKDLENQIQLLKNWYYLAILLLVYRLKDAINFLPCLMISITINHRKIRKKKRFISLLF